MAKANPLRQRWLSTSGQDLTDEIAARLVSGRPLSDLPLETHEGRMDLRCLPLPSPRRLRRFEASGWFVETLGDLVTLRDVQLASLDLSGAELSSLRFFGVAFTDCRFEGTTCRDWRLWDCVLTDCSFARSSLRGAVVGSWDQGRRNKWRHIDFAAADLRGAVLRAAVFEDCDFTDAKLVKLTFEQCAIRRCRFGGPLKEVVFDGRELAGHARPEPLEDVDFTRSTFDQVEFMGYTLDQVALPDDPDLALIKGYRSVIQAGLERLSGNDSRPARMLVGEFRNRLRMMRGPDEDNVFNARDYRASGDEGLAELASQLIAGRARQ